MSGLDIIDKLFTTQSRLLKIQRKKALENIVGKGENVDNQHFLLFPHCFLPFPSQSSVFHLHLICHLQMLSIRTSLRLSVGRVHTVGKGFVCIVVGVLPGSVVRCLTPGVLGSSRTGSSGFLWECPLARHFRAPA